MSASAFLFLYYQETYFVKTRRDSDFGRPAKKRDVAANKVTYRDTYFGRISGLSQTRVGDFPRMVVMPKITALNPLRNRAKFLLLATIYELEGAAVDEIISKIDISVYVVGPNIPHLRIQTILPSTESSYYYKWLESKSPKSVLYVSLGSLEFVPSNQIGEIMDDLKRRGVSFLWPTWGETSRLSGDIGSNGLVVEWCDQERVLLNGSVGGFLTHCGWNSIQESLYAGVPMLNFPIRGDQPIHYKLVHQDWKVGHNLKIDDTFEEAVRDFMGGNSRTTLLENLKGVEDVFRKSMEDYKEVDCFIRDFGLMLNAPAAAIGTDQVVIVHLPEIGAVTNFRSRPHWLFSKKLQVSPVKMLFGRQMNQNGRSRFTSSDRCYLSSEHLYGEMSIIDTVASRACVSQFSDDGRLLVASFQNGDMKIYSVENNSWRTVKETRLTHFNRRITDTPLSPNQHYIAYSSSEYLC